MSEAQSWVEHLSNAKQIRSLFPCDGLPLSGLLLVGLDYRPGNKVRIALQTRDLPSDAPSRWRDRGISAVEMCFDVGVSTLSMQVSKEFDEMPLLNVAVGSGHLSVRAQDGDDLVIELQSFYSSLEIKPLSLE